MRASVLSHNGSQVPAKWLCEDFCALHKYTQTLSLTLIGYNKWGIEGGVTSGVFHVLSGSQGTQSIPQSPLGCCPWPLLNARTHAYSHYNRDLRNLRPGAADFPELNSPLSPSLDSHSSPLVSPSSQVDPLALSGPLYRANKPRL